MNGQQPWRGRHTGLVVLAFAVAFLLSGAVGAFAYFLPALAAAQSQIGRHNDLPTPSPGSATPTTGSIAPFTVLLLGSDDDQKFNPKHILTQSMILVRVDPATRQVTMLSIPRDLWVPLPSSVRINVDQQFTLNHESKIDLAYAFDGPQSAITTVEQDFGIHIDDYIWIGLKGLIHLIDYVGGIDLVTTNPVLDNYYPNDIASNNPYGYDRVAVLPGPQHLDGVTALQYVRARHSDLRGDFGRSIRQQEVLLALRSKAKFLTAADLPGVATAFNGELKTSMSLERVKQLVELAGTTNLHQIHQIVLLGNYTTSSVINGEDVLLPNWNLILPLVHKSFP